MADTLSDLRAEASRLKAEIDRLQTVVNQKDEDGTPSAEAITAQKRLDKLNDDYRQALNTLTTAEKGAAPAAGAPTMREFDDGTTRQWNAANKTWDVVYKKPDPAPKANLPDVTAPTRRPGQRTDTTAAVQAYRSYRAQLEADVAAKRIDPAEAARKLDEHFRQNVQPVIDQANREAQQEADRLAQQQNQTHAASLASSNAGVARSNYLNQNDSARLDFDRNKLAIEAGKDAVTAAREANKQVLGSGQFGEHLAAFLSGGAGSMPQFTAADLQHPQPDYDAIAEQATQRVLQRLGVLPAPSPPTAAPVAAPSPVAAAPPPPQPTLPPFQMNPAVEDPRGYGPAYR